MKPASPHRGRFAPSPTGRLHLGNARSALLGWLWARAEGGQFLLRIEDLDASRSRAAYLEDLFADLDYLGLTFDEEPLYQSQRGAEYDAALARLSADGRVYPCFCSRAEVARAASAPHGPSDEGPRYPGLCAQLSAEEVATRARGRGAALRFRAEGGERHFTDLVAGEVVQDVARTVGDFVVRRSDGIASYQLAVVVDDHASAITHVLRADDLLASTPRQIDLYRALGWTPPTFAHVGLLVDANGRRMAKREGALSVADLRKAGVPGTAVVGLLSFWSGLSGGEPVEAQALVGQFQLGRVARGPVVVEEEEVKRRLGL